MYKKLVFPGLLACMLVVSLAFVSCKDKDDDDSGSGGGSSTPKELVGKWTTKSDATTQMEFEITEKTFILGSTTFDLSISGNKIDISTSGSSMGTCKYELKDGELKLTEGTVTLSSIASASPFVKK